jgi:hypothetical protein
MLSFTVRGVLMCEPPALTAIPFGSPCFKRLGVLLHQQGASAVLRLHAACTARATMLRRAWPGCCELQPGASGNVLVIASGSGYTVTLTCGALACFSQHYSYSDAGGTPAMQVAHATPRCHSRVLNLLQQALPPAVLIAFAICTVLQARGCSRPTTSWMMTPPIAWPSPLDGPTSMTWVSAGLAHQAGCVAACSSSC